MQYKRPIRPQAAALRLPVKPETYEQIVKSHRTKRLLWDKRAVGRIDRILRTAAKDTLLKLKEIAGTGSISEIHKAALLNSLMSTLDTLQADYATLNELHLLGAGQIACDREAAIAGKLFTEADLEDATRGLRPEFTKSATLTNVGTVEVTFGQVAESAVNIAFQRIHDDGLSMAERLWKLDSETRRVVGDKVVQAIAQGTSARDLAKDLRGYLTDSGKGNARYNSMRLAVTEINNVHREAHIQSCLDANGNVKEFISGVGWRLSNTHPEPDVCDVYASQDLYGLGRGNYPPGNVPVDHPHGRCNTTTLLVSEPDMQFVTKEPEPDKVPPAQLKRYGIEAEP